MEQLSHRPVKSYQLLSYLNEGFKAENAPNSRRAVTLIVVFLGLLLNFLFLNYFYKKITKIFIPKYVIKGDIRIGGYSIVDKLNKGYIYFGGFYILPEYQNIGYGSKVLDLLIDTYKEYEIRLDVDKDNDHAIHLYLKYGFSLNETENGYQMIRLADQ
ncbi:MAG: GNAT family N-acetyltransferase [Candidatus Heimdallarchaeota archaeon]|nr:GNAT family N-acetyltransferase [Candidatus Heimdallarchaeota archaeon]